MDMIVDIDEIDDKILHILIQDARTSLKDIAKECAISSVSVLNRIKRLKKLGVITGATLYPRLDKIGFNVVATIGMKVNTKAEDIVKFLEKHTYLIESAMSIGEYDLTTFVFAEDIISFNEKADAAEEDSEYGK